MKSIFALVFGLFMAISASFSQSDSLMVSAEIPAILVEDTEKDTSFIVTECDPLCEMSFSELIETDCALLSPIECKMITMENVDKSTLLPVIQKITHTEKFYFSVSDVDRTPDSVKEFVESVNDSTVFIAETNEGKLVPLNSFHNLDQYEKIIIADTIMVNERFFVFDSTQVADIQNIVNDNYHVKLTEISQNQSHFVSGYTEEEEMAKNKELAERGNGKRPKAEQKTVVPKKQKPVRQPTTDLVEILPSGIPGLEKPPHYLVDSPSDFSLSGIPGLGKPDYFQFVSNPSDFGPTTNKKVDDTKYSNHQIIIFLFGMMGAVLLLIYPFVYHLRKVKKNLPNMTLSEKKGIVKIEPKQFRFLRKFLPSRKKLYKAEPAEEGAPAPSS